MPAQHLRRDKAELRGGEVAGDAGERAGNHERGETNPENRKAEGARAALVVARRRQRPAERRAHQHVDQRDGTDQASEHDEIECDRLFQIDELIAGDRGLRLGVDIGAIGAAGDTRVVEQVKQHLAECERDHDEIDTAGAQRQRTDDERDKSGGADRHRKGHPQRCWIVFRRHQRQCIAGDAEEGCMAQADQPAMTDGEIQRHRQQPHDQRLGGKLHVVGGHHERQCDREHDQHADHQPRTKRAGFVHHCTRSGVMRSLRPPTSRWSNASFPPPLWGRDREGGDGDFAACVVRTLLRFILNSEYWIPPSPALAHKGGGSRKNAPSREQARS